MSLSIDLLNPAINGEYYQSSKTKSLNNNSTAYYQFSDDANAEMPQQLLGGTYYNPDTSNNGYMMLPKEDTLLLEKIPLNSVNPAAVLHKSNSYHGTIKTKSTVLKQDIYNGRIATSLTDTDNDYVATSARCCAALSDVAVGSDVSDENVPFLEHSSPASPHRTSRSSSVSKSRQSICFRAHSFISRNWYLSYLVPLSILLALIFVAYLMRDYAKRLLYWIELQNPWVIFAIFIVLFIAVSFPVVVGYFVLMITSGYLFGCIKGFVTVILGAHLGIAIAHVIIRSLRHRIPIHKFIKNETGRAILRVISGPKAFKVVLFTRLTPIPFGIQNTIFGVSTINTRVYHTASFLGLLPAQTINVYLGSTLRSMHEVLNNHGTALTGYISFGVEVVCGIGLMFWVVQKARKELSKTLLSDISNEGKLIDIQV